MGIVVPIRSEFVPPEIHARPVKVEGVWYQWYGIEPGRLPKGHPPLEFGPRGKVLLKVGQVWVELRTNRLWVIRSFEIARTHLSYPHDVELTPYRGVWQNIVSEATLHQTMHVWEDAFEFSRDLHGRTNLAARFDPTSPWRGAEQAAERAQSFFGFDQFGNRMELVKARTPKPKGGPPRKGSVWKFRNGRLTFVIDKHIRERGEKLFFSITFTDGKGYGAVEYNAREWHEKYVPADTA